MRNSSLKHSHVARVNEGSHIFYLEWTIPAFTPHRHFGQYSFSAPLRVEGWVGQTMQDVSGSQYWSQNIDPSNRPVGVDLQDRAKKTHPLATEWNKLSDMSLTSVVTRLSSAGILSDDLITNITAESRIEKILKISLGFVKVTVSCILQLFSIHNSHWPSFLYRFMYAIRSLM